MNHILPKQIGDHNKNQILSILRERGPTSRVELSRLLEISATTITRNASQLLKAGIIQECGAEESDMGRKPVLVELRGDFCYVLGADIVGGTLKIAMADLMGEIVEYYEEPIQQVKSAHGVLEQLIIAMRNTIVETKTPVEKIWVAVIGTPGIFDPDKGKSQFTFFLDGWDEIDIRAKVHKALAIETLIENDVNLDVIGESWKGIGRNYENILYVKLGQGLAARIVLQNKLLRGKHNMAGEIGYMLPGLPQENVINYEHMLCNAGVSKSYGEMTGENTNVTISNLYSMAAGGNKAASKIIYDLLDQLAVVLLNSTAVLDPEVIILGGEACCFGKKEITFLKQRMEQYFPLNQNIITSKLNRKACFFGAIKTGLDWIEERITDVW